ncbi:hypothetical protein BSTEL_1665 [Bifidobacterium stellenboschense]|uniref:Uncharacterized protein n=1 Tax=Bifidobacterium stellenboschense TaxID=762211 RepID=A0A087DT63_9BIFI|nr:hypothetical protein BSTEL_1665 [Bifidobacterium stellenboschense]
MAAPRGADSACRSGASPHPTARIGAARVGHHGSVACSPLNVVAMLCGAPQGCGSAQRVELENVPCLENVPWPESAPGPKAAHRITPGVRRQRHKSRTKPLISGIRDAGRGSASRITDESARFPNPGRTPTGQRHKSRTKPLNSGIRDAGWDTGKDSASRVTDEAARFPNWGRWERLGIPGYGRRRSSPALGTLGKTQHPGLRTKPLFSGICDAGADIGAYRPAVARPPSGATRHLPPAGGRWESQLHNPARSTPRLVTTLRREAPVPASRRKVGGNKKSPREAGIPKVCGHAGPEERRKALRRGMSSTEVRRRVRLLGAPREDVRRYVDRGATTTTLSRRNSVVETPSPKLSRASAPG